jgi:hypothetical protein
MADCHTFAAMTWVYRRGGKSGQQARWRGRNRHLAKNIWPKTLLATGFSKWPGGLFYLPFLEGGTGVPPVWTGDTPIPLGSSLVTPSANWRTKTLKTCGFLGDFDPFRHISCLAEGGVPCVICYTGRVFWPSAIGLPWRNALTTCFGKRTPHPYPPPRVSRAGRGGLRSKFGYHLVGLLNPALITKSCGFFDTGG